MQIDHSHQSPNHAARDGHAISMLVLHATVGSARSALAWLTNPAARVSAHYLIDKGGRIYQLVADERAAWHAGRASWQNETAINEMSLGIELENANNGRDPYPEAQLAALVELARAKVTQYAIAPHMVTRHVDVALPRGRKSDPAGFPWQAFLAQLFPDISAPSERPRRPEPPGVLHNELASALLAETYRQVGAAGQQRWALGRTAMRTGLGLPVGPTFEVRVGGRLYTAQSFGHDTLACPMGAWQQAVRLSALTDESQAPLRDALLEAVYAQAGETYHPDWAMHQEALRQRVGPPLDRGQRLTAGGQTYVVACYAQDILYSPVDQWRAIGRLSTLPGRGAQAALHSALSKHWLTRIGGQVRTDWPIYQEAIRSWLGAPLGPSFRVSAGGHDYAAEAFALDALACEIGVWSPIIRLSDLLAVTEGGKPHVPV
jgi:N-acetylmuramoyl-L-alanine amidase